MATVIAVYNSEGLVGRCDAKCHNAQHPNCTCVCGGANHGGGLDKAIENTREMAQEWIEQYVKDKDLKEYYTKVLAGNGHKPVTGEQLRLF